MFCRGRLLVGIAGNVTDAFVETVRRDIATLPAACAPRVELPAPQRPSGLHVVVIDKPSASATAISLGHPLAVTRRDEDHAALRFASDYLGLHRQSVGVLYQSPSPRGPRAQLGDYAYAEHFAQEGYSRFPAHEHPAPAAVRLDLAAAGPRARGHFALRAALRATQALVDRGMPEADVTRIRTFLDGYAPLQMQTASARLGDALNARWNGWGDESWASHMRARWGRLDAAAIRAVVARHLSARDAWVAIVAPNAPRSRGRHRAQRAVLVTYESPKPAEVMAEDREIAAYPLAARAEHVRVVPLEQVFRERAWLTAAP